MQELLKEIQKQADTMPQAQQAVADYILAHYQDVPFLSVTALAAAIGVSDTTVIKFCTRLGFPGYAGFRRALSGYVQSELTMYGKLETRLDSIEDGSLLDEVLACDRSNVELTLNNPVNRRNFDRLLQMLDEARTIYICGFRTAAMQAEFLAACLSQQARSVVPILPGTGHFTDQLSRIGQNDLFLAFVFSRYSSEVIHALQFLQKEQVPCVAITDTVSSPAYGLSDLAFLCETASCSYQGSYAGCTALINAIVTGSSRSRRTQTAKFLKRLEDVFVEFDTFYR